MILELIFAGGVAWVLSRAVRQYSLFHRVDGSEGEGGSSVRVVVPMRNERENAGGCVEALSGQAYAGGKMEIVVVDDDSTDGTYGIVEGLAGGRNRVMRAGPLPAGWTGKCHACWRGVQGARADYFCFVDADVRASRELLRRAVGHARAHGIDMLSLEPMQEMGTVWERLILPAGFLLLAATQDLKTVNDPACGAATANGQFILIRREVYEAVGGHKTVKGAVAEDSALAEQVKGAGYRVALLDGGELVQVRMYRSLGGLWEGLEKTIPQMLHGTGPALMAGIMGGAFGVGAVVLPIVSTMAAAGDADARRVAAAVLAWGGTLALLGTHIGIARRFGFPIFYALLFPAGYLLGAALVMSSVLRHWRGEVRWRGRTYPVAAETGAGNRGRL